MTADDFHKTATLLRTLASAEQARLSANSYDRRLSELGEELHRIMDPVDPIECMALAALMDAEAMLRKVGLNSLPERPIARVRCE